MGIILVGSLMLGATLVLYAQIVYNNVASEREESCDLHHSVDSLYAVYVEKVYSNGTKTFISKDLFNELVLKINQAWMDLSKKDSLAMVVKNKCLVKGRGIFYCQDDKVVSSVYFKAMYIRLVIVVHLDGRFPLFCCDLQKRLKQD